MLVAALPQRAWAVVAAAVVPVTNAQISETLLFRTLLRRITVCGRRVALLLIDVLVLLVLSYVHLYLSQLRVPPCCSQLLIALLL